MLMDTELVVGSVMLVYTELLLDGRFNAMIGEVKTKVEGYVLKSPLQWSSSHVCCTKPGVASEFPVDVGPQRVQQRYLRRV